MKRTILFFLTLILLLLSASNVFASGYVTTPLGGITSFDGVYNVTSSGTGSNMVYALGSKLSYDNTLSIPAGGMLAFKISGDPSNLSYRFEWDIASAPYSVDTAFSSTGKTTFQGIDYNTYNSVTYPSKLSDPNGFTPVSWGGFGTSNGGGWGSNFLFIVKNRDSVSHKIRMFWTTYSGNYQTDYNNGTLHEFGNWVTPPPQQTYNYNMYIQVWKDYTSVSGLLSDSHKVFYRIKAHTSRILTNSTDKASTDFVDGYLFFNTAERVHRQRLLSPDYDAQVDDNTTVQLENSPYSLYSWFGSARSLYLQPIQDPNKSGWPLLTPGGVWSVGDSNDFYSSVANADQIYHAVFIPTDSTHYSVTYLTLDFSKIQMGSSYFWSTDGVHYGSGTLDGSYGTGFIGGNENNQFDPNNPASNKPNSPEDPSASKKPYTNDPMKNLFIWLFVPDDGYIPSKISQVSGSFNSKFGMDQYVSDLKSIGSGGDVNTWDGISVDTSSSATALNIGGHNFGTTPTFGTIKVIDPYFYNTYGSYLKGIVGGMMIFLLLWGIVKRIQYLAPR